MCAHRAARQYLRASEGAPIVPNTAFRQIRTKGEAKVAFKQFQEVCAFKDGAWINLGKATGLVSLRFRQCQSMLPWDVTSVQSLSLWCVALAAVVLRRSLLVTLKYMLLSSTYSNGDS